MVSKALMIISIKYPEACEDSAATPADALASALAAFTAIVQPRTVADLMNMADEYVIV